MELDTYKTVTFKDRLMQAVEQIRAVDEKMEKILYDSTEKTFLKECQKELRDCQNTLLTLHKEILFYVSQ